MENSATVNFKCRGLAQDRTKHYSSLLVKQTHRLSGPFSWTTRVSQYQKGKTNVDFSEARDSEWWQIKLTYVSFCVHVKTASRILS